MDDSSPPPLSFLSPLFSRPRKIKKIKKQGADFIECDAVFTSDCALVCRHDADLSRSTDAASKFGASRTRTREIDGVTFRDGVFAADLSLAEVRTLRARQAKAGSLGRSREWDGLFPVATLDEFAEFAASVPRDGGGRRWNETSPSSPPLPRRVVGVHVEAKHPLWHSVTLPHCAADPAAMVEAVAAVLQRHGFASHLEKKSDFRADPRWLRAPTFLQCFEPGALAEAHRRRGRGLKKGGGVAEGVPLVQLVDGGEVAVPGGAAWWSSSSSSGSGSGGDKGGAAKNLTFADLLTDAGLERVAGYAHAIGPSVAQVLDFPQGGAGGGRGRGIDEGDEGDKGVAAFSSLAPRAARQGLAVHAYTLRDDSINLDRFKRIRSGALREAEALFSGARVEGAFGDFPSTASSAAREERERRRREERGSSSFAEPVPSS